MRRVRFRIPRLRRAMVWFLFLSLATSGCSKGWGEVSGKVTYKNLPLPCGTIQFQGSDGIPYPATIKSDGTYTARVPEGQAKVLIQCRDDRQLAEFLKQASAAGRGGKNRPATEVAPGSVPTLPDRYGNWKTSGLKVTITRGENTHDFDLQE